MRVLRLTPHTARIGYIGPDNTLEIEATGTIALATGGAGNDRVTITDSTTTIVNTLALNEGLSLQNESATPTVPAGYHTLYSYNNGSSFEIRANDGTLDRNIPLIAGSAANDQCPVPTLLGAAAP
jgi:hypothetical protein